MASNRSRAICLISTMLFHIRAWNTQVEETEKEQKDTKAWKRRWGKGGLAGCCWSLWSSYFQVELSWASPSFPFLCLHVNVCLHLMSTLMHNVYVWYSCCCFICLYDTVTPSHYSFFMTSYGLCCRTKCSNSKLHFEQKYFMRYFLIPYCPTFIFFMF